MSWYWRVYAQENGSYGLVTLLRERVSVGRDGSIVFDYPAKSGQERIQAIAEPTWWR